MRWKIRRLWQARAEMERKARPDAKRPNLRDAEAQTAQRSSEGSATTTPDQSPLALAVVEPDHVLRLRKEQPPRCQQSNDMHSQRKDPAHNVGQQQQDHRW